MAIYADPDHEHMRCNFCGEKLKNLESKELDYDPDEDTYICRLCADKDPAPVAIPRISILLLPEPPYMKLAKPLSKHITLEEAAKKLRAVTLPRASHDWEAIAQRLMTSPYLKQKPTVFPHRHMADTKVYVDAKNGTLAAMCFYLSGEPA